MGVTVDRLFKVALLAVLLAFLYVAWGMKDNGRYVYEKRTDRAQDVLIDTRTGRLFYLNVGNEERDPASVEENPLTGAQSSHWAWWYEAAK